MKDYQVIIIGGGLAGLTAAIDLCVRGIEVILFEKESYPHHKVCGEYLSNEILPYLNSLGVCLNSYKPPEINKLIYSSNLGDVTSCALDLGGIGISRYTLDQHLYNVARAKGCEITNATVKNVLFQDNGFKIFTKENQEYQSEFVLGAFGKRSNLDKMLQRSFIENLSSWLAVKAHYKNADYPGDTVSLHNFQGGYCGLSRTELNTVNVCYLTSYRSFQKYKNTDDFRKGILLQNPRLKEFFGRSKIDFDKELSIAQVSFDRKSLVDKHILMLGDAAGLIHPLCGNGMAMAIHSAKLAVREIGAFYHTRTIERRTIEKNYKLAWRRHFERRVKAGRILQGVLLNQSLSTLSQNIIRSFPGIMPYIIKNTHGQPVYA